MNEEHVSIEDTVATRLSVHEKTRSSLPAATTTATRHPQSRIRPPPTQFDSDAHGETLPLPDNIASDRSTSSQLQPAAAPHATVVDATVRTTTTSVHESVVVSMEEKLRLWKLEKQRLKEAENQ